MDESAVIVFLFLFFPFFFCLPHDGDCRDVLGEVGYVIQRVRVHFNLDGLALGPGGEIPATRGQRAVKWKKKKEKEKGKEKKEKEKEKRARWQWRRTIGQVSSLFLGREHPDGDVAVETDMLMTYARTRGVGLLE